jgi:hypothetical protein
VKHARCVDGAFKNKAFRKIFDYEKHDVSGEFYVI